jgi:hypothetical protein
MTSSATIDHTTLARLVEAGAVRATSVIGQRAGWGVLVKYGNTERPLASKRGHMRLFRKLETVVSYLKELGIAKFDVELGAFDAEALRDTRARPDTAAAMKRGHQAIAHDKWFRRQVDLGLHDLEADKGVSEKAHDARWAKRRASLVKRASKA